MIDLNTIQVGETYTDVFCRTLTVIYIEGGSIVCKYYETTINTTINPWSFWVKKLTVSIWDQERITRDKWKPLRVKRKAGSRRLPKPTPIPTGYELQWPVLAKAGV